MMEKTVIVLDRSPYFGSPCGQAQELDAFLKSKAQPGATAPPTPASTAYRLEKSLWTCGVEASLEYHRVIRDLFHVDLVDPLKPVPLVRFIVSDSAGRFLTPNWAVNNQTSDVIHEALANLGPPDPDGDQKSCSILHGITLGVEAISQITKSQKLSIDQSYQVENEGRIVCLTHLHSLDDVKLIQTHFRQSVDNQNKVISNLKDENTFMRIRNLQLSIVNIFPHGETIPDEAKDFDCSIENEEGICLNMDLYSTHAGKTLTGKILHLVQLHQSLASTTVSGIPMKEEQNTGSSANYDVELLHRADVLTELKLGGFLADSTDILSDTDYGYKTVRLKWCSPASKGQVQETFNWFTKVSRVTPVIINSRPSACLVNFILSGRTVQLEVVKHRADASTAKLLSHMLINHGGHIYIHSLKSALSQKSILDEPPGLTDTPGSKVIDYRNTDFGTLMKECRLVPCRTLADPSGTPKAVRCRERLASITRHWPLTMSTSFLFSTAAKVDELQFLTTLIRRNTPLSQLDFSECSKVVDKLVAMEKAGTSLTAAGSKSRGSRKFDHIKQKDDQYRLLWTELEAFVAQYAHLSPGHVTVLEVVTAARKRIPRRTPEGAKVGDCAISAADPVRLDAPLEQLVKPRYRKRKVCSVDLLPPVHKRFRSTDTPESPPMSPPMGGASLPPAKTPGVLPPRFGGKVSLPPIVEGKLNLLDMWTRQYNADKWAKWRDFDGRVAAGNGKPVELYPELMARFKQSAADAKEIVPERA